MQLSYSRVSTFVRNPLEYRLRYLEKLKTLPEFDPKDPLILGTAMHTALQESTKKAVQTYFDSYPIITDRHIEEAMKIEGLAPKARKLLPPTGKYEVTLSNKDFIGFIDMLTKNDDGTFDIWDFKYSNSKANYLKSPQLHLYKYYFEQLYGKVNKLHYLFIPKIGIRQKQDETLFQFRQRLSRAIDDYFPETCEVEYDPNQVISFLTDAKHLLEAKEFPLDPKDPFWKFSQYRKYVEKGEDYMIVLPSTKRRNIEKVTKRKLWIYGAPFSGKTTFVNEFPDPLDLTTDGNIQFVDMPYLHIKDTVEQEGRRTIRTFAWQNLKDTITELEKKDNEFKTVALDLVDDSYEMCRLYMYDKLGIEHESDDSFRAWDKVLTEFLSVIRRFMNLDYENIILISHEDTSKDITKRTGDKITAIKPNIREKVANKLAGMVDIVARLVANGDERYLNFKSDEVIFGGGRLSGIKEDHVELSYEALVEVYDQAAGAKPKKRKQTKLEDEPKKDEPDAEEEKPKTRKRRKRSEEVEEQEEEKPAETEPEEIEEDPETGDESEEAKPRTRKRRARKTEEEPEDEQETEEKPRTRRRRKRTTDDEE